MKERGGRERLRIVKASSLDPEAPPPPKVTWVEGRKLNQRINAEHKRSLPYADLIHSILSDLQENTSFLEALIRNNPRIQKQCATEYGYIPNYFQVKTSPDEKGNIYSIESDRRPLEHRLDLIKCNYNKTESGLTAITTISEASVGYKLSGKFYLDGFASFTDYTRPSAFSIDDPQADRLDEAEALFKEALAA